MNSDRRKSDNTAKRVLFWVVLPPPYAGPEVASAILMDEVRQFYPQALIENATVRKTNLAKGKLDLAGLIAFAKMYLRYIRTCLRAKIVYIIIAPGTIGFLRDSALIWTARALGKKVVMHLHGGNYQNFYRSSSGLLRFLIRQSWGRAHRAIVQAPCLEGILADSAPKTSISVLPNGLPPEDNPAKSDYRNDGVVRLLFLGYLSYTKGFYDLFHVFTTLRKKYPTLEFTFAGERPRAAKQFATFLSGKNKEFFVNNIDGIVEETNAFVENANEYGGRYLGIVAGAEKLHAFHNADIFVLPSYMEGFSLAMLEAMFAGLPIVTSAVGAAPDVIRPGVNGYLVEPGNRDQLGESLEKLIVQPELREKIGRHNAEEARQRYSIEEVARSLVNIVLQ